jgi:hypothetical protein
MADEKRFFQDTVKVVLHVQTQNGWDAVLGATPCETVPLTRPYGLEPGLVFQARTLLATRGVPDRSLAGALVEVERYHAENINPAGKKVT